MVNNGLATGAQPLGHKKVTAKLLHTGLPSPVPGDSDSGGWGESQTSPLSDPRIHQRLRTAGPDCR